MKPAACPHDGPTLQLPIAFIDALSRTTSVEEVLNTGALWLPRLIDCTRCSVAFLVDGRLIAQGFRSDGRFEPVQSQPAQDEKSCRGRVLSTGQPVFLDHAGIVAAGGPVFERLLASGIRSILIAPMLGAGRTLGTLAACRMSDTGFSQDDTDKLIAVGKWIGSQARLMQKIRAIARQAETDALTGLANRARLMRVLDGPRQLHVPGADGRVLGVLHIDLDFFKDVNDRLGHAVGDAVLRHAAMEMRAGTSAQDLVARVGGDEFVVVTRTDTGGRHIARLANDLVARISRPVRIGKIEARIGASIGTAMASSVDRTADRLIGNADIALYDVKRNGRGGVCAFSDDMRRRTEARRQLLSDLKTAVEHGAFEAFFQPFVALDTGQFSGFEMLARWPHPTRGVLDPEAFLDIAVEAGVADQIDCIVRSKGLAALRKLRADGWDAPKMSFNASARTLCDPDLVGDLMWDVLSKGLSAADLVIEIREAHLIDDEDGIAARNIAGLAGAGFAVELDDFGTGHAEISNLARLSISGIKLDRSLVAALPNVRAVAILRAILSLADDLNLTVAAKGVENSAQFAQLRGLGCHTAQGFGISQPLPLDGLETFMRGYGKAPIALAAG